MADRLVSWLRFKPHQPQKTASSADQTDRVNQILVIGFGPSGQKVVQMLTKHMLEAVVIDVNPGSLEHARQLGLHFHLGDAAHEEILQHAELDQACMAVVTIPDPQAGIRVVEMIRRLRPLMPIVSRCRYSRYTGDLERAGADVVVDEEMTMGDRLSQKILELLKGASNTMVACRLSGRMPDQDIDSR